MSLTVKKIPFGSTNPFSSIQRNFSLPATPQNNSISQPQMLPQQINQQAGVPTAQAPAVVSGPTAPVPQTLQPTALPIPIYQPQPQNSELTAKTIGYVGAGLALLSLGLTGYNAVRHNNSKNITEALEKTEQKILGAVDQKINPIKDSIENLATGVENKLEKERNERTGLGKWFDGITGDIGKKLQDVKEIAEKKSVQIITGTNSNFLTKEVNINGSKMHLANTLNGYGIHTELLQKKLQTESTKRMFGLIDRSKMEVPDTVTVRVPTSEFKGIASTGGMSIVPKEVMANLGAFVNSKQKMRLIVDMPMYLGEVENNTSSGRQVFYALNALNDGTFSLVSKPIIKGDKESTIIKKLEKLSDFEVPIYDDNLRTMQHVEVFMAKGLTQQVDYKLLRRYLSPEELAKYDAGINRYLSMDYPGIQKEYAPLKNRLKAATDKEYNLLDEENSPVPRVIEINKQIKEIEKTDKGVLKEFTETKDLDRKFQLEEQHKNNIIRLREYKSEINNIPEIKAIKAEISALKAEIKPIAEKFKKDHGTIYKNGLLSVFGDLDGHIKAQIEFDGIFYKNDKFDMKGPRLSGSDANKNIYNNKTINSGETERFAYFDKYFYEFLTKSHETTNEKLGADLIIGNDWQTGGISAMTRLLTKAKEAVGELTPEAAEKLYNTPIITILHNAQLAGRCPHSQSKILNVLFGEHAAMIAENAHMPDISKFKDKGLNAKEYELPDKCWNGLMHSDSIDMQTMAASYSDVIVPVSDKYYEEIGTQGVYGRENFELFRLRKWVSEHADKFKGQKTMIGVTNGCDKVNNVLSEEAARKLERDLKLPSDSLQIYDGKGNVLKWHNHNKTVILRKVIADVKAPNNPMNLKLQDMTDLTGVNENTMVVSTAGRIVDQKGLDIYAEAIEEFLRTHKFPDGNYPVFYAQGTGGEQYVEKLLEIKQRIAQSPELGGKAAADRIVFAELFSEPGRYDACKLMSDFSIMSSWFEPCGLVHKEIAARSGAIPIVNETGGLTSGLTDGVDAIFSKFKPASPDKTTVIVENKKNFADAMWHAYEVFSDKQKFGAMMKKSYDNDFSWLIDNGPMAQYVKILTDLKVLKPQILSTQAA